MRRPIESKEEAIYCLQAASAQLAAFGVTDIGMFGSFVTGGQSSTSDIDILVQFAPDKHSFDNFMDLSFFLENLFGRRVDSVTADSLSPHIGPHILRELERVSVFA